MLTGEPMPLQKLSLEQNSDAPFDYTKLGHDLSTEISYLLVWEIMGISMGKSSMAFYSMIPKNDGYESG